MAEIEQLPEEGLPLVLSLIGKLKAKQRRPKVASLSRIKRDPEKNPLRGLIGIADVAPFAHKIDEELEWRETVTLRGLKALPVAF